MKACKKTQGTQAFYNKALNFKCPYSYSHGGGQNVSEHGETSHRAVIDLRDGGGNASIFWGCCNSFTKQRAKAHKNEPPQHQETPAAPAAAQIGDSSPVRHSMMEILIARSSACNGLLHSSLSFRLPSLVGIACRLGSEPLRLYDIIRGSSYSTIMELGPKTTADMGFSASVSGSSLRRMNVHHMSARILDQSRTRQPSRPDEPQN